MRVIAITLLCLSLLHVGAAGAFDPQTLFPTFRRGEPLYKKWKTKVS